jgi:hypothetical protein
MADPINPSKKRVVKKTDIKSSDKKSTLGTETKTVYRRDKVTPKKVVTTDYANYYTPKGSVMGGSTVLKKEKQKFDRAGKLKSTTTLTPVKKMGGATDDSCWPGKPGCGKTKTIRGARTKRVKTGPAPGRNWMSNMAEGGAIKKISKMQMGGDPTIARKCPKGKCGKISVAPIGGGMETTGSKLRTGFKDLFTKKHKAGPSGRKRIR